MNINDKELVAYNMKTVSYLLLFWDHAFKQDKISISIQNLAY